MNAAQQKRARRAILKVGDGRGFVVQSGRASIGNPGRYVITAAHCLPKLPPAHPWSYTEERTFRELLGPLGEASTVWAECVFADPIRDIAVLVSPDNQELSDQAEAYEQLIFEQATALRIGDMPESRSIWTRDQLKQIDKLTAVWLLHLDGQWLQCSAKTQHGAGIMLSSATKSLAAGMSGSPCVTQDGRAIGVFGNSGGIAASTDHREGGPQARLTQSLPGWLLRSAI